MRINIEKTLFVTELSGNGDEGMRNWIKMADRALSGAGHQTEILRLEGNPRWASFYPRTRRAVQNAAASLLIYVPYSGLTSKALLRHAALRNAAKPDHDVLVTLQAAPFVRGPFPMAAPTLVAFASERLRDAHRAIGRRSCVLPPIVDHVLFCLPVDSRPRIREELGLSNDKPMALHVGHLRRSRGLEPLADLARSGAVNVVIIASTSTEPETGVVERLREAGVLVKREFLPHIERWYQAADVYVFPVVDLQGSIEIPLTVLEAMACGTPVVTTPFGGLTSLFASTESMRFAPAVQLAGETLQTIGVEGSANRQAVIAMDEAAFAVALERAMDGQLPS